MGRFIDTSGNSTLGIGICGRCSRKMPIGELRADGNSPGLLVCQEDWDGLDPYRLAPRAPDQTSLPFTRPEVSIATQPYGLITEDGNSFIVTQDEDTYLTP